MQVKNAVLHCSYSAPVRVSVAFVVVVAARADTFFFWVVGVRVAARVVVLLLSERGIKTETDFALLGFTMVFIAFRDVVDRTAFFVVLVVSVLPRVVLFSVRTAPYAEHMHTEIIQIKLRIFFISYLILANF
jgi:hypothetical protein